MQAIRELPQLYKLELQVSKQDRKISVQCSASALDLSEEHSASLKEHQLYIQLWLIEDHIVAPQHLKKGLDNEYEHNHIFRQALNGIDGEPYDLGKTCNHTGTIDREIIQLEHCAVVPSSTIIRLEKSMKCSRKLSEIMQKTYVIKFK